jgi:site-specific DNA-methyltransferase (adenine-specific)
VIRSKRVHHEERLHQTQKPVDLLAKLVKVVTREGDTVLDPFAGSGSTGEACAKLGRNFIGIEKSTIYHQVATQRLYAASEQASISFITT